MEKLTRIGFVRAGSWTQEGEHIKLRVDHAADTRNVLYAFIVNGDIRYIGKTTQPLKKRMYSYENPGPSQSTNIKNNAHILNALKRGNVVEIYVLADDGSLSRGGFHINIAAGLEDSLIEKLRPSWNHGRKQALPSPVNESGKQRSSNLRVFKVRIGKAYYENGFFNVGVKDADYFSPDGADITVGLGKTSRLINATINRRANPNGTPRIMCGTGYRDWVQRNYNIGESFRVEIYNPLSILLR